MYHLTILQFSSWQETVSPACRVERLYRGLLAFRFLKKLDMQPLKISLGVIGSMVPLSKAFFALKGSGAKKVSVHR